MNECDEDVRSLCTYDTTNGGRIQDLVLTSWPGDDGGHDAAIAIPGKVLAEVDVARLLSTTFT